MSANFKPGDVAMVALEQYMAANTERKPGACWVWTGPRNTNNYGRFALGGQRYYAHRAALMLALGRPIADGMFACHACDNPPCVNPAHLHEGTQADNMREAAERGRARNRPRYGMDHHHATVPPERVAEAVALYMGGGYSHAKLAAEVGVSAATIGSWVRGDLRPDAGVPGFRGRKRRRGVGA